MFTLYNIRRKNFRHCSTSHSADCLVLFYSVDIHCGNIMMVYNPSKKSSERETQEGKQIEYQRLKKKMKKKKKERNYSSKNYSS